ncbi:MAG: HAD family hydrolase [Armatimonadota bacterium]|nr:HAD family hydrolase [Armatimonadota bacterium]
MRRAVFLDRDGVINEDRPDYVKSVAELKVFSFAPECIRKLNSAGFEVYVISNQQCVGKGIVSRAALHEIECEIERLVGRKGGKINGFYYCTHLANQECECRKPKPGLLLQAAREHNLDLQSSFMIGDSEKDVTAGHRAGCRTVVVLTGAVTAEDVSEFVAQPDFIARDLVDAVNYVLAVCKSEMEADT